MVIRIIVLCCAVFVSCGCATDRSYTSRFKETVSVGYFDGKIATPGQNEGAVDMIAGYAIKAVVALTKAAINHEAAKYEAKTTGSTTFFVQGIDHAGGNVARPYVLNQGGVLFLLRTISVHCDGSGACDEPGLNGLVSLAKESSSVVDSAMHSLAPWGFDQDNDIREYVRGLVTEASSPQADDPKGNTRALALATVIVLRKAAKPAEGGASSSAGPLDEGLQLVLAGYRYSALKAKQAGADPFGLGWDKVESTLTVSLQGPSGQIGYAEGHYQAGATFGMTSTAKEKDLAAWRYYDPSDKKKAPKFRSDVLAVPAAQILKGTLVVLESSDMKKTLESLAKEVGDVKLTPKDIGIGG